MACVVYARAEGNPSTSRQSGIVSVRYGPDRERFQILFGAVDQWE